ncbi:MAG: hypothetical protein U0167_14175 [bacterium]
MLHVPWVLRDEPRLFTILRKCYRREDVEVVAGRAPAWDDPWARAIRCRVVRGAPQWEHFLADDDGREVERARHLTDPRRRVGDGALRGGRGAYGGRPGSGCFGLWPSSSRATGPLWMSAVAV